MPTRVGETEPTSGASLQRTAHRHGSECCKSHASWEGSSRKGSLLDLLVSPIIHYWKEPSKKCP